MSHAGRVCPSRAPSLARSLLGDVEVPTIMPRTASSGPRMSGPPPAWTDGPLQLRMSVSTEREERVVRGTKGVTNVRIAIIGSGNVGKALATMGFLNIAMNARNGGVWQSTWKLLGPLATPTE